jgi:hypothetical protein
VVGGSYAEFYVAMAGAGAALIGLLFVAVSINPERTFGRDAPPERRSVAASAFMALIVAFFVSTAALLPRANVGGIGLVMGALGLFNSARLGLQLAWHQVRRRKRRLWLHLARVSTLVAGSLVIYGFLFSSSVQLLRRASDASSLTTVAVVTLACYGLGLYRAWELLGAPRQGITGWLNPLLELDDAPARAEAPAADGIATATRPGEGGVGGGR